MILTFDSSRPLGGIGCQASLPAASSDLYLFQEPNPTSYQYIRYTSHIDSDAALRAIPFLTYAFPVSRLDRLGCALSGWLFLRSV